jgi:AraC-like DNA-binding protein
LWLAGQMDRLELKMPKIDRLSAAVPGYFSPQIETGRRFYHPPRGRVGGLVVVSAGSEKVTPDYHVSRKRFDYYGIEFVAAGSGSLVLAGRRAALKPGAVFSYGPATAHDIRTDPDTPLVKYFVDLSGPRAAGLLRECKLKPGTIVHTSSPLEVIALFDDIIRNGLRESAYSERLCRTLLEALALKLAETAVSTEAAAGLAFGTFQRCREMLLEDGLRIRSVNELAERCGVDAAYLCRLFRRFDHESPYKKLIRLKMHEAAGRLQREPTSIKQLASEFGFADQYHFSRAFKRIMGVPPTHVRSGQVRSR